MKPMTENRTVSPSAISHHGTPLENSCQLANFQARSKEYMTRRNNIDRFCQRLDFTESSFQYPEIIPHEGLICYLPLVAVSWKVPSNADTGHVPVQYSGQINGATACHRPLPMS